jgi:hypothetical protein
MGSVPGNLKSTISRTSSAFLLWFFARWLAVVVLDADLRFHTVKSFFQGGKSFLGCGLTFFQLRGTLQVPHLTE